MTTTNRWPAPRASAVALLAGAVLAGCGGPGEESAVALTPVAATAEWPASTPEAEGLDPVLLTDLARRLHRGEYGTVSSVLVVRNGRLVVEEYHGWSASQAHRLQSVTKSVTSLLVGIAVDEGRLRLDDRVPPLLPAYAPVANLDENKAAMTVRDLLTMRSGLDWREWPYEGSPLQRLNTCRCDWLRLILDWPLREPPGTRWEYVSGAPILLAGLVSAVTGEPFDGFAAERLFRPLGFTGEHWDLYSASPPGLPHTGGGLSARPRDMAKLGTLVLDGGRWQGQQVVSEEWVAESTARTVPSPPAGWPHPVDYGYLWWVMSLADPTSPHPEAGDVVVAAGAQGQWIFVVPRHRLVMTATGERDSDFSAMYAPDFLYTHVLASVRR